MSSGCDAIVSGDGEQGTNVGLDYVLKIIKNTSFPTMVGDHFLLAASPRVPRLYWMINISLPISISFHIITCRYPSFSQCEDNFRRHLAAGENINSGCAQRTLDRTLLLSA